MNRQEDDGTTLRTAVVGLGWWGRQLVDSLDSSRHVAVTDVVEPDLAAAGPFCDARHLRLHGSLDEMLGSHEIDAVMVVTPHRLHEEQVLAAAAAGKHVFCEKPFALTAAAADRMLTACAQRDLAVGVGHERRFEGALEELATRAADGTLGTLLHMECHWSHNLFVGGPDTWRKDPQQAPAGTLTALGVHITDFFISVAGRVTEVRAVASHRSARFPSDDVITVQFRFESGVTATLTSIATTPFYSRITLFGDDMWAEAREWSNVDVPEPALLSWRGTDDVQRTRTFAPTNTVKANIEQWARSAIGLGHYRFTHEQILHNVEVLEAIVTSAATGRVVTVAGAG
jgi:predicted dehydrogenase